MTLLTLTPKPLDQAAFAPFGRVLELGRLLGRPVNEGRGVRVDVPLELEHHASAQRPITAFYHLTPSTLPFTVSMLERHPRSAQSFMPTRASRYLVVVATPGADGEPDVARTRAFVGTAEQAVVYAPTTWHLPLVALDDEATFLMHMWEVGKGPDDCVERPLVTPLRVI